MEKGRLGKLMAEDALENSCDEAKRRRSAFDSRRVETKNRKRSSPCFVGIPSGRVLLRKTFEDKPPL